jgi:thioesterase domain-containing protein/acyl carrier protein
VPGERLTLTLHQAAERFEPGAGDRILAELRDTLEWMADSWEGRVGDRLGRAAAAPGNSGRSERHPVPESGTPSRPRGQDGRTDGEVPGGPRHFSPFTAISADTESQHARRSRTGRRSRWTPDLPPEEMPRDLLELQLVQIWESVLGIHPVRVEDDFFELGGNSIAAARLFDQIERVLGTTLPLATLFEAKTIQQICLRMRDGGWSPPWSSLVAIQPEGTMPPLFCIHSFEGHVLIYSEMARHLAPDQPVYGVQAMGLDGRGDPLSSVEAMAEHYLPEIRRLQPTGPYHLVGLCFGLTVALELARRLREEGEEVGLYILDSGFAPLQPRRRRTGVERIAYRIGAHGKGFAKRTRLAIEFIRSTPRERRERRIQQAIQQAWNAYRPQPVPGPVMLLVSEGYGQHQQWFLDTWSQLVEGSVATRVVPGDHFTFFREPNARHLAEGLRACTVERGPRE